MAFQPIAEALSYLLAYGYPIAIGGGHNSSELGYKIMKLSLEADRFYNPKN